MSHKIIRYSLAVIMSTAMVLVAELFQEHEIIFPEIVALLIGSWIAVQQPWKVNKPMMVGLMSLSAIAGVCIVRYLPIHTFFQAAVGFIFIAVTLTVSRTTMFPALSACILPILLKTTSWIYPLSVCAMCLIIVGVRLILERFGLVKRPQAFFHQPKWKKDITDWIKRFGVFLAFSALAIFMQQPYFIAPPLLVTFIEFSEEKSRLRRRPKDVLLLLAFSASVGTLSRLLFSQMLHWPLTIAAFLTVGIIFLMMEIIGVLFAPVGALAFLPFILPAENLWLYPIEATIGAILFILAALFLFRSPPRKRKKPVV